MSFAVKQAGDTAGLPELTPTSQSAGAAPSPGQIHADALHLKELLDLLLD